MTQIMKKSSDVSQTTTPLGYIEPTSPTSGQAIIQIVVKNYQEVSASPANHRGTGMLARDMVARHEQDGRRAAAIQRARAKLSDRLVEAQGKRSLAAIRLARGLSQTQLADMLGLKQPQIARLENGGIATAGAPTIKKLRDALRVTADEIIDSE